MIEPEYREEMRLFYRRLADFMSQRPELFEELNYEMAFLKELNMPDGDKRGIVLDWYIFDHKSKTLSKNLLEYFIENSDLDEDTKILYSGLKNTIYSIFQVKAIRTGKEMKAYDMLSGKEFSIKDTSITKHVIKGQLVIMRALPYKGDFILTGKAFPFPSQSSQILKLSLLSAKNERKPQRLTPLTICKIFYTQEKPEKLPPPERFRLICKECSLDDSYIDEIIQRTKEQVENKGHFNDIQQEFVSRLRPHANFDIKELIKAHMDVWNGFITGHVEKGPIEIALINAGMTYVQQAVNTMRHKDMWKAASIKAEKAFEDWLDTKLDELDGSTPKELILKEREDLGNTVKIIKFSIAISHLAPGEETRKKAEEAVNKAMQLLGENKPKEALELYKEHLAIVPKNHVAWLNLGVAHILLSNKKNAESCFRKALEIKPNYKVAKNNIRILENATEDDIKRMAEEYRVQMVNQGKRKTLNIEDMYDDIYEQIDRPSIS